MATPPTSYRQSPPSSYGERPALYGSRRSFTAPHRSLSYHERAGLEKSDASADILYSHPSTRIIKFTPSTTGIQLSSKPLSVDTDYPVDAIEVLPWASTTEALLATGSLKIEKVRGSTNFLKCKDVNQAILRNSQCWLVDGVSKFVLRVGKLQYYRIELPSKSEEDTKRVEAFKEALQKILRYEATPCPFKRGFHVELADSALTPRRKGQWKRREGSLPSSLLNESAPPLRHKARMWKPRAASYDVGSQHELPPRADSGYGQVIVTKKPHPDLRERASVSQDVSENEEESDVDNHTQEVVSHQIEAMLSPKRVATPEDEVDDRVMTPVKVSDTPSVEGDAREEMDEELPEPEIKPSRVMQLQKSREEDKQGRQRELKEPIVLQSTQQEAEVEQISSPHQVKMPEHSDEVDNLHESDQLEEMEHLHEPAHLEEAEQLEDPEHLVESKHLEASRQLEEPERLHEQGHLQEPERLEESEHHEEPEYREEVPEQSEQVKEQTLQNQSETSEKPESLANSTHSFPVPEFQQEESLSPPLDVPARIYNRSPANSLGVSNSLANSQESLLFSLLLADTRRPPYPFPELSGNSRRGYGDLDPTPDPSEDGDNALSRRPTLESIPDDVSVAESTDSFHTSASLTANNKLATPKQNIQYYDGPTPLAEPREHDIWSPQDRSHRRDISEMTITASTFSSPDLSKSEPILPHPSSPDIQSSLRYRGQSRRSLSPLPPSSTIVRSTSNSDESHITTAILQKAASLALVKPVELVVLVVHILARIAGGATMNDLMSGELFRRPQQGRPGGRRTQSMSLPDGIPPRSVGLSEDEDDYGVPLRGRTRSGDMESIMASPAKGKEDDEDSLADLD